MARIATDLADHFRGIPSITALVGDRIFDFDPRTDGWDNLPVSVFNDDAVMLPTLVVTEQEYVHQLGAPARAQNRQVVVWGFSNRSPQGYNAVDEILSVTFSIIMADTPMPIVTKSSLRWTDGMGPYTASDGVLGWNRYLSAAVY